MNVNTRVACEAVIVVGLVSAVLVTMFVILSGAM